MFYVQVLAASIPRARVNEVSHSSVITVTVVVGVKEKEEGDNKERHTHTHGYSRSSGKTGHPNPVGGVRASGLLCVLGLSG